MLNPERVAALQAPISEASPAGDNLEYDSAFIALATASQGKAEQQFGDTVIAAVEPEWREVDEQAQSLLERTKDARVALLLLRANTRLQGIEGFSQGLALLHGLLDRYWDVLHPQLDADDDNDPTMRLNALAPLADETTVLRELYDAQIGVARGSGPLRIRDVAMAYGQLAPPSGEAPPSTAQVDGALAAIHSQEPQRVQTLAALSKQVNALQSLLSDKTGRGDAVDLAPLRALCNVLAKASAPLLDAGDAHAADAGTDSNAESPSEGQAATSAGAPAIRGDIRSRQDALAALDRVIHYLQQAEPGNPAPLLISRAKKLIGVSFMEIMADLAPSAIETIEGVTGRQQQASDDE
ncbi:type VI secretion system protein TssA [Variovorax dokdonensis]|uniref:Type VI secretion system protein TssA n=1 Tax=Variovorax dokdonensis TaxID=344883 RepID=A0ABT7NAM4_9BURK|nr:type VI secretion system protein TssA [Variovorax dokdonensis]MDM0044977.1 type VI secretion system protein TssA [Variovorax dokdonensis]